MKKLIEIAKERGAYIIDHNTAMTVVKGEMVFANEAQLLAAHADYCKQFEPIYQCRLVGNAWADIRLSEYKRRPNFEYRTAHLAPQIPSEVKSYIERLEHRLDMASAVLEVDGEYPLTVESIKDTLASKPDAERLDFVQAQTKGWSDGSVFRGSINGKCVRLHETGDTKGNPDAKEAIDQVRRK